MNPIPATSMRTRTVISKTKFNRWLSEQPDNRTFDFVNNHECLFASFLNEANPGNKFSCGSQTFTNREGDWTNHDFPQWAIDISAVLGCGNRIFTVRFVRALLKFKTTQS